MRRARRGVRAATAALAALSATPVRAEGAVTQSIHDAIMKSGAPIIRRYLGASPNKALAACIDWAKSTGGKVAWPAASYSFGLASEILARANAITNCGKKKTEENARNCTCQLVDVNGRLAN
jgi:hypothetical protein